MISSSREVVSGFRGAALNQSRSASGVYTGLLCWLTMLAYYAGLLCWLTMLAYYAGLLCWH
ncbi:hypothetical protein F1L24_26245 [Escherichia coli]|nr:hypothetical protein [Escherichia coli]